MDDREPGAKRRRPAPPARRHLNQFRWLGESLLDGLMRKVGMAQPLAVRHW